MRIRDGLPLRRTISSYYRKIFIKNRDFSSEIEAISWLPEPAPNGILKIYWNNNQIEKYEEIEVKKFETKQGTLIFNDDYIINL